jgi:uncharacterized repeat protein (TIGR03803 family)
MTRIPKVPAIVALAACLAAASPARAQVRYETLHTFSGDRGRPFGALVEGPDGRLYGTTVAGGFHGRGTVFAVDASGIVETIHEFNGADGAAPRGALVVSGNTVYGTTSEGGALNLGTIFKLSLTPGATLETLLAFNGFNGSFPQSGLLTASDGNFYGTTQTGGPVGFGQQGTVFRLAADGSSFATLYSFDGANGALPYGSLIQTADGSFYGTTERGGAADLGTVFQIPPGGPVTTRASFTGANGAFPRDGMIEASDGDFYGTTVEGGADGFGTVFRLPRHGDLLETLVTFSGGNGKFPRGGLRELGGFLYGTTQEGGANGVGTLFRFDKNSPAPITPTTLHSFAGTDGASPASGVMQTSGDVVYGTTEHGGPGGYGTIFQLILSPTPVVSSVAAFTGAEGADPSGPLLQAGDGNFYGTTISGGTHGFGTVFRRTPDGDATTVASFDGTNGAFPSGGLIQASDTHLYGTTEEGGANGQGTAFQLNLTTGELTTLASFDFAVSGAAPKGGLFQARDGHLYGTTELGGTFGFGGVFRLTLTPAVSLEPLLVEFDGTNGAFPTSGVIQGVDDALYGTTEGDVTNNLGTVFRLQVGSPLETLVAFDDVTVPGDLPAARLLLASDGNFYGTTAFGGATGDGTVFSVTPASALNPVASFNAIASFNGINGSFPKQQGLIAARDGHLYGTATFGGGPGGSGVVYRLAGGAIVPIHIFDGVIGANPNATLIEATDGALHGTTGGPQGGVIFRIVFDEFRLQVPPAPGNYRGMATLSATLTKSGLPVAGGEIVFKLRGVVVGAATTNGAGVATVGNVLVFGLDAGPYADAVTALFDNAGTLVQATGDLTIAKATPTFAVSGATYAYDQLPHPASTTLTGVGGEIIGPLVVTYNGVSAVPIDPGIYNVLASYAGNINYEPASGTAVITIVPPVPGLAGLVAAFGFNEGGGSLAADASGKGHTGSITEAQYVANGRFGRALLFDGINDWVTVADAADLDFATGLTMEAWVNPGELSGWNTIALKERRKGGLAYALYANDDAPQPAGYIRNSTGGDWPVPGTMPVPLNTWTHLAITYDGATFRLYVNGVEANRRSVTGRILATDGPLRIGGNAEYGEFLQGMIDEIRIYGRALTPSEIQRDMNMPIVFETAPPTVSITSPMDGAGLSGMPAVNVTATDNVAIATVHLEVDDIDVGPVLTAAPFVFRLNVANGPHVVKAVAMDTAGNVTVSSPVNVTIANVPVADYPFNEADGAVLDVSGHGNNGTMSAGVSRVTDDLERRTVLSFNGINGMVTVLDNSSLDLKTGVTLSAWVKPTTLGNWRTVILKESVGLEYALYANQDVARPAGFVHIGALEPSVEGNTQLSLGAWTHLAMTYDSATATMRLFVNGTQVKSRSQTGLVSTSDGALRIGGNSIWGEFFNGRMDDVRIYDVAVSQAQIQADMNATR